MSGSKKALFIILISSYFTAYGQETPLNPVSNKIFSPFVFNPAMAGSKDFLSLDLIAALQNKSYTQILSGNARLLKSARYYSSKSKTKVFSNVGLGGAVFNDLAGEYRNVGISLAGAYHIPLDKKNLSFFSVGVAAKGIYNHYPGDTLIGNPEKNAMFPNVDAGLYYYNPTFYAGVSANNILGNPGNPDSLDLYSIPVSREYFFTAGFKLVLSRQLNIVLEPSVIINADDSFSVFVKEMIHPGLRIYLGNFCIGSYLNDYNKIPFFFQYKYPGFYIGTFFELPRNTPFYKKEITAEIVMGVNITYPNSRFKRSGHW